MMFDKNDTNFSGEVLCITCKHCLHYYGSYIDSVYSCCALDHQNYHNVGVCKDYEDIHK